MEAKKIKKLGIFFSIFLFVILLAGFSLAASIYTETFFIDAPGSIWTTRSDCGNESQDVNHYPIGDDVYIDGAGFFAGVYEWYIKGQPEEASCDPNIIVASGNKSVNASGAFCFNAYTVQENDCGEYQVKFGNKGDNYQVEGNACNNNFDCGSQISELVCQGNNITNFSITPSCLEGSCTSINSSVFVKDCGDAGCLNGQCNFQAPKGYYVLDGWGGVHNVGSVPSFTGGPYWKNWDIARDLEVVFDSSRNVKGYYVLDGYGGVHNVSVPKFSGIPYFGWDIARDLEVVFDTSGNVKGYYVLDGYGGVHKTTGLPGFSGGPYWKNWDIARDLEVVYNSSGNVKGYYVLDGYGGVHNVGNVSKFSKWPYWQGWDIARDLEVVFDTSGNVKGYYVLDGWGGVHNVGNVSRFSKWPSWSWDIARDLEVVYDTSGNVKGYYVLDGWGGVHPVGDVPKFSGGAYWKGWDIARDLEVV